MDTEYDEVGKTEGDTYTIGSKPFKMFHGSKFAYVEGPFVHGELSIISDIGLIRTSNQDSFYVLPDGTIAVMDGLGGHSGGEEAAEITALTGVKVGPIKGNLEATIEADKLIKKLHRLSPLKSGAGTTIISAKISRGKLDNIVQAGDSRLYLFDENRDIYGITTDDSEVQALVNTGILEPGEASRSPMRNRVTSVIGNLKDPSDLRKKLVRISSGIISEGGYVKSNVLESFDSAQLNPNSVVIFCTDGMNGMVTQSKIEETVKRESSAKDILGSLWKQSLENGARDNVTIAVYVHKGISPTTKKEDREKVDNPLEEITRVMAMNY